MARATAVAMAPGLVGVKAVEWVEEVGWAIARAVVAAAARMELFVVAAEEASWAVVRVVGSEVGRAVGLAGEEGWERVAAAAGSATSLQVAVVQRAQSAAADKAVERAAERGLGSAAARVEVWEAEGGWAAAATESTVPEGLVTARHPAANAAVGMEVAVGVATARDRVGAPARVARAARAAWRGSGPGTDSDRTRARADPWRPRSQPRLRHRPTCSPAAPRRCRWDSRAPPCTGSPRILISSGASCTC